MPRRLTSMLRTPPTMSRPSLRVMAVVMSALVCAAVVVSAGAKVPGANGRIAFERADPASKEGDTFVFTANPDGSDVRRLGPSHTCCAGWSADGSKLAIAASTNDNRITTATVNPDGSDYEVKTIPDRTLNLECNVWSPTVIASPARDGTKCTRAGRRACSACAPPTSAAWYG
jgi:hypothetical protein